MSLEIRADLQSSPAAKTVPESTQAGTLRIGDGQLRWTSTNGGHDAVVISIIDISREWLH
jgi:hypothetical protein